jgi:tetratricopeptide (TPR) repeat protein
MLLVAAGLVGADEAHKQVFADRAQADFHHSQALYEFNTNDPAAAWQFGRACYNLTDFVTNNVRRAELASLGIAASRQALERQSNSAPAHYYLAIELGQLADTKRNLSAFKLVREMEREFKTADDLDAHFDYAGPSRCLGLLYRDAPGWPVSVGNRHKARECFDRATRLAPDYPENHLILAESCWQWKDRDDAAKALKTLDALWPTAQTKLTGEAWEQSWADWTERRDAVRKKIGETGAAAKEAKTAK